MASERLHVTVVVACPDSAHVIPLELPVGATLRNALERARLDERVPDLDLAQCRYGIHGRLRPPHTLLREGDRVEVYRPLSVSPKERRRARAALRDRPGS